MRGKVAKRIRREVYGDLSIKQKRKQQFRGQKTGQIINDPKSPRTKYQEAKKRYQS